jgi:hypothetical protein
MASTMAGISRTNPRGRQALAALGALAGALVLLLSLLAPDARAAKQNGGIKADSNCPALPTNLAPKANRFTMLIRINQLVNANTWNNYDTATGGLGGYVKPQDIFVINSRFEDSNPLLANEIANALRLAHPCNRIISLNGMGFDPTRAGYAFTLIDNPSVYALMTDFEPMDWVDSSAPNRAPWSYNFKVALPRIKKWNGTLAGALANTPGGGAKRSGLVPLDLAGWSYGQIAQDLDKKNRRLGGRHLGPLSVQTQDTCANSGAGSFGAKVKSLLQQYVFKFVTKKVKTKKGKRKKITVKRKLKKRARPNPLNLAVQISFSNTPNPNSSMAITKTSAKTAAACTQAALAKGGGPIFYFASPDSMRLLFQQPEIAALRPAPASAANKPKN